MFFVLGTLALVAMAGGAGLVVHLYAVLAASVTCLLGAITLHEYAHGMAAFRLGDTTARDAGRLTLNPFAHLDRFGMTLPIVLAMAHLPAIGWAKPVPVDMGRLRRPRRDMTLVALAGPAASLTTAIACAVLLRAVGADGAHSALSSVAWRFAVTNMAFGLFNCLPFYPMDGGRALAVLLPDRSFQWLSRHEGGVLLLSLGMLFAGPAALAATTGFDIKRPMAEAFAMAEGALTGSPDAAWTQAFGAWAAGGEPANTAAVR